MLNIDNLISHASHNRWSVERAHAWQASQPWLVGANYLPSYAINQLEMWQEQTFNPAIIDRELAWAADIGMNSMRVFLHDLLWMQDAEAFLGRIEWFLQIAAKRNIGVMLVFFDSCWYPFPYLGPQREPEPGVHNSFWLQSPGLPVLQNPARFALLEPYVKGVIHRFKDDSRVQVWDLWNEPDNGNAMSYGPRDLGDLKGKVVLPHLAEVFSWARSVGASQPLTSGVWVGDWDNDEHLSPMNRLQLNVSDVVSFHRYNPLDITMKAVDPLKRFDRPILCTEYMARGVGSTFEAILPYFKENGIGAYNWGLVQGRSQTNMPWDSWQIPYQTEPPLWFHDVFRTDGTPYREAEVEFIRRVTGG